MENKKKRILILMSGSIACYKLAIVLSHLKKINMEVRVAMSTSATEFLGASTVEGLLGEPPLINLFQEGSSMDHIHWMRWADLILAAPATGNFINSLAAGITTEITTTMALAHDFKKPFWIAPSMNTSMLLNPITQKNLHFLETLGFRILRGESGVLACGEKGEGRLVEPEVLLEEIDKHFKQNLPLKALKILVTSGGTQEPIDSVRVISNVSSGKTGKSLVENFQKLGATVFWLRSEASQDSDHIPKENKKTFTDFKDLYSSIKKLLMEESWTQVFHLAAVSDYSVESIIAGSTNYSATCASKISSDYPEVLLNLQRNPKIVNHMKEWMGQRSVPMKEELCSQEARKSLISDKKAELWAFKLTSGATEEEALSSVKKLFHQSSADWIVHNDLHEIKLQKKGHPFHIYKEENLVKHIDGVDAFVDFFVNQVLGGSK